MIDNKSAPGAWERELVMRPKRNDRELWGKRNGELHVLARLLVTALREANPEHPLVWEAEKILADVPQERR